MVHTWEKCGSTFMLRYNKMENADLRTLMKGERRRKTGKAAL